MPRPVYIVAAESVSEDSRTNAITMFKVIERIEISLPPADGAIPVNQNGGPEPIGFGQLWVVAVWMKQPEDNPERSYQHQFAFCFADGTEQVKLETKMSFTSNERPLSRVVVGVHGVPSTQNGIFRFESRIRADGEEQWMRQDYPLTISVSQQPAEQSAE